MREQERSRLRDRVGRKVRYTDRGSGRKEGGENIEGQDKNSEWKRAEQGGGEEGGTEEKVGVWNVTKRR